MAFSSILNTILKERKISAYRMAKDTGISERLIGYWKSGEVVPENDNLIKISRYFDVPIDFLLGRLYVPKDQIIDFDSDNVSPGMRTYSDWRETINEESGTSSILPPDKPLAEESAAAARTTPKDSAYPSFEVSFLSEHSDTSETDAALAEKPLEYNSIEKDNVETKPLPGDTADSAQIKHSKKQVPQPLQQKTPSGPAVKKSTASPLPQKAKTTNKLIFQSEHPLTKNERKEVKRFIEFLISKREK